jgi:hypothetical protein
MESKMSRWILRWSGRAFRAMGILACLLPIERLEAAYSANITAIPFTGEDYILDADEDNGSALYQRDRMGLRAEVFYTRGVSDPTTVNMRLAIRLLDGGGTAVGQDNGAGGSTLTTYVNFTLEYGTMTAFNQARSFSVKPAGALSLDQLYQVEVTVQRETSPGSGSYVTMDTDVSAYRRIWHFTGKQALGGQRNVKARIRQIDFDKLYAVQTGASERERAFVALAEVEVRRYDAWTEAVPLVNNVDFRFRGILRDNSPDGVGQPGTEIALEAPATWVGAVVIPQHEREPDFNLPVPAVEIVDMEVLLTPLDQLASASEEFAVFGDLEHIEVGGSGVYVTDQSGFPGFYRVLQHFNGDLLAPGTGATLLMQALAGNPGSVSAGANFLNATISLSAASLKLNPNYTLRPAIEGANPKWTVDVRLFDDGRAELQSGVAWLEVPEDQVVIGGGNNLRFERANMVFGTSGITADVSLLLPHGMGVRSSGGNSSGFLSGRVTRVGHPIVPGFLLPTGPVVFEPEFGHFVISEETKPFTVQATNLTWSIVAGDLIPGPVPAGQPRIRYVRDAEVQALNAAPLSPGERITRSNEAYYRLLDGAAPVDPVFRAAADGSALFTGTVGIQAGFFRSHFPYDVRLEWTAAGTIAFVDDLPSPGGSQLNSPLAFALAYARDCAGFSDCGLIGEATVSLSPDAPAFAFSADGGLMLPVNVTAGGNLQIGYIDALTPDPGSPVFAHRTNSFASGSLLTAGHFSSGQTATLTNPAALLHSGFDPAAPQTAERPESVAYATGAADYPGLNLRVADQAGAVQSVSVLGGLQSPAYALGPRSKYYVRKAGVSGIHDPSANPFPDPVVIYGYTFEFSQFALSFESSEVRESRTIGSLYIPDPAVPAAGFTVDFDPLLFSCVGALTHLELAGGPFDHTLNYWNADIRGLAAAFEPAAGEVCDPSSSFFTLGAEGHISNFSQPLLGTLVFAPDGDLVPGSDPQAPAGRDSRFAVPATLRFAGAGGETYTLMPLHGAYLNRHAEADGDFDDTAQGFMNLAGLLDVAFFRDLEVHIQTGARKENTTDVLHLIGGWSESGDTYFNAATFDLANRAHPPAAGIADYRALADPQWRVRARQEWLDVVNFDYALDWQSAARVFIGSEPVRNDLMVLSTEHRLVRLSSEVAEIDFGSGLDVTVPSINLSGLAQSTPLYAALHQVADTVTDSLLEGLDASDRLLNDLVDQFFDDIFAATVDPFTEGMAAAIADGAESIQDQADLDQLLDNGFDAIEGAFKSSSGFAEDVAAGVAGELNTMRGAIDAVAGPTGYFQNNGTAANPRYNVGQAVVVGVVEATDPPLAAAVTASVGAAALDEITGDALAERAATIEQVKDNMLAIDGAIDILLTDGGLEAEIVQLFTGNPGSIDDFLAAARARVDAALDPDTIGQWAGDSLNELLRDAIRDQFNASPLIADFNAILRGYVYELDAAMRSGIDSACAQVNQVILDIVDDFLPIDGPLRSFLGDLAGATAHGKLDGYARIQGDALRTLRIDAEFETSFPDPFTFNGYLEIRQVDSSDFASSSCFPGGPGDLVTEVMLGAENVKVGWMGKELRFDVDTKFSFSSPPNPFPVGMAGAFEMTGGAVSFEAFKIDELGAGAALSLTEHYLAAKVGVLFNGDRMYGGIFLGKTCSLAPIEIIDEDVARVLPEPNPSFTGIYAYGQAFIPIVNVGCLFNLSASAGAGIFMFHEDDTYGGKMLVGANARALCAVNIGGELSLVGLKSGNQFNFTGAGRIYGSAGKKPLQVRFDERVTLTYKNSKWDYDF